MRSRGVGWGGPQRRPPVCPAHRPVAAGRRRAGAVTDLLDADAVLAVDLLWLYLERWGIERLFQKVTEVFLFHRRRRRVSSNLPSA